MEAEFWQVGGEGGCLIDLQLGIAPRWWRLQRDGMDLERWPSHGRMKRSMLR